MAVEKTKEQNDTDTASTFLASVFGGSTTEKLAEELPKVDLLGISKTDEPIIPESEKSTFFTESEGKTENPIDNPYEKIAQSYGIEFTEEEIAEEKVWDFETLKEKFDNKIEESSKKLNLEEFNPDARKVIEFFSENKGNLVDFYKNKELAEIETFKNKSDEELWKTNAINKYCELGYSALDAANKVNDDIEVFADRGPIIFKAFADNARVQLDRYGEKVINDLIEEKNKFIEVDNQKKILKATQERGNMVKELKKLDNFMGIRLNEKDREFLEKEINSGKFLEKINKNPAQSQLMSYLSSIIGEKIVEIYSSVIKNTEKAATNRAVIKFLEQNHNSQPAGSTIPKGQGGAFNSQDLNQVKGFLEDALKQK
jgi:hypothetical protein